MPRSIPPELSVTLTTLRRARGWTAQDLAEATGISTKMISVYEIGRKPPSRERVEKLAAAMGYPVEAIDLVLLGLKEVTGIAEGPRSPVDPTPAELRRIKQLAAREGLAVVDLMESHLTRLVRARRARQDRRKAAQLWKRLRCASAAERRRLVESSPEFHSWALAERLCHESEEAAADRADRALDLASLACRVAELIPGEEAWRSRLQGYCLAFLANARRVGNDMPGAEEAFARAWKLWNQGTGADPALLTEWRLLDLEGSLRRDQRRFPEALRLLDRARNVAPPHAVGRVLVKKAVTLEHQGEAERAIEVLREAVPYVDQQHEPRLLFSLRFNLAVDLCHLGRYGEAEELLAGVRELAVELRKELDLVRIVWLEGKMAAGLGRASDAQKAFQQVRRDFTTHGMAYDYALVSLELALLLLEQGHTSEIRALVREMLWIFRDQGIHREALAALDLFRQAVEKETVTAETARRVVRYLYRAQHDPELRFQE
jgi:transcriptional regulator with XRE-family HTH domain